MADCTRCGTATNNPALSQGGGRGRNPLSEYNGVVWLCDGCLETFLEWLEEDDG